MKNKINKVVEGLAAVFAGESANEIHAICNRYDLGDCSAYQFGNSKAKFYQQLLSVKGEAILIDLAKRVMEDFQSDHIAGILNAYYDGGFFRISIITRAALLEELLKYEHLNGKRDIRQFLEACGLEYRPPITIENIFDFNQEKSWPSLDEIIKAIDLYNKRDSSFISFLEQIVHPYTRSNKDAQTFVDIINWHLNKDGFVLAAIGDISGESIYKILQRDGVSEKVKNLIFASNGYKPELVLDDALSNKIRIVKHGEKCLVYDEPIKPEGLLYVDLVRWWSKVQGKSPSSEMAKSFKERLSQSLASPPERILFDAYFDAFKTMGAAMPALIPQVYLHYDPYTINKNGIRYLLRQRMDFLMLFSDKSRVVIEVDGKQHYAHGDIASPELYAEMVSQDRELRLLGYEVYRFGGYELIEKNKELIVSFFKKLFEKHGLILNQK